MMQKWRKSISSNEVKQDI